MRTKLYLSTLNLFLGVLFVVLHLATGGNNDLSGTKLRGKADFVGLSGGGVHTSR